MSVIGPMLAYVQDKIVLYICFIYFLSLFATKPCTLYRDQ